MQDSNTNRSPIHGTFTLERIYDATPERVFQAWADPALKAQWFSGPADRWTSLERSCEFRVGGQERARGQFQGGRISDYRARYHQIRTNELLVYDYDMFVDDTFLSVSLSTVEILAHRGGTRLVYTEQGVYFDGNDGRANREEGTRALLENLVAALRRGAAH
ncbi:MAG: SRPBCC family protein [Nannocystaceae bacterium]